MALVRPFFNEDLRDGTSQTYSLARDVLTERVFVLQCKTKQAGLALQYDETKRSLADFLGKDGAAQSELLALIGTLVIEE